LSLSGDNKKVGPKFKLIKTYIRSNDKAPFEEWIASIRDKSIAAKIFTIIDRLRLGNFGDCKSVGNGVLEMECLNFACILGLVTEFILLSSDQMWFSYY